MEMAKYIMRILKSQLMVMWSWGFNSPIALTNGLRFKVNGFKFKGIVEVVYNEGTDLFDISFIRRNIIIDSVDGCYIDMLVNVIDNRVEKVSNYEERVKAEYSMFTNN